MKIYYLVAVDLSMSHQYTPYA